MGQNDKSTLLKHLEMIDQQLQKSQLVNSKLKNSERSDWAGSEWTEEADDTKSAPGGTDYNPPKKGVFKNIDQMSEEEIQRHLAMRKSRLANPIAAEAEILKSVPGVEKAICPKCDGTQYDALTKSVCDQCNGFGYVWMVPNSDSARMIKSIEAKWNVTKAMPQPKGTHQPGGKGDANPCQTDADPSKKPEKVGPAARSISKAKEIANALNKAKKGIEDLLKETEDKKPNPFAKDDDEDEMEDKDYQNDEELMDEGEEDEEKCVKGISNGVLARSLQLALTSVGSLASQVEDVFKSIQMLRQDQQEQANLLYDLANSHMDVTKSLLGGGNPRAARGPKAAGPGVNNIQVLQKSFVDNAPGENVNADGSYQPKYDLQTLKKGVTQMIIEKKLNRHVGMALEVGTVPEEKILKSIESYIDEHGVEG